MIDFVYHDSICREISTLEKKRFRNIRKGFSVLERLCDVQFSPTNPIQVIAPAKLHRVTQNDIWTMWKVELIIPDSGLRPSQFPRIWFAVKGAVIAFLCISTHIDNYKDGEMDDLALLRITDIF